MSPVGSASARDSRGFWREHPISSLARLAQGAAPVLAAACVGVGVQFLLQITAGMVVERRGTAAPGVALLDRFLREISGPEAGVALVLGLVGLFALGARSALVSRSLVRLSTQGADRAAVPCPWQLDAVVAPVFSGFLALSLISGGLGSLLAGAYWLSRGFSRFGEMSAAERALPIALTALALGLTLGAIVLPRFASRAHTARRVRLAEHWTPEAKRAAWIRARSLEGRLPAGAATGPRRSPRRVVALLREEDEVPAVSARDLRRAVRPRTGVVPLLMAGLGGPALVVGLSVLLMMSTWGDEAIDALAEDQVLPRQRAAELEPLLTTGLIAAGAMLIILAIALASLRLAWGRAGRSAVLERWPVRPEVTGVRPIDGSSGLSTSGTTGSSGSGESSGS